MTSQPNPGSPEAVKLGGVSKPMPALTTEDAAIAELKDELRKGVFLERHFWNGMANFYAGASK